MTGLTMRLLLAALLAALRLRLLRLTARLRRMRVFLALLFVFHVRFIFFIASTAVLILFL